MAGRDSLTQDAARRDSQDLGVLVSTLASASAIHRESARRKLISLGKPAVPLLIQCLSDPNRQVRWEAAKALGEIRDPAAATALVGALEDRDGDVRWLAAVALSAIGREALRPLFAALLERSKSDWLREGAHHVCHDLSATEHADVVRPVLAALNAAEPELTVPGAAYTALHAL